MDDEADLDSGVGGPPRPRTVRHHRTRSGAPACKEAAGGALCTCPDQPLCMGHRCREPRRGYRAEADLDGGHSITDADVCLVWWDDDEKVLDRDKNQLVYTGIEHRRLFDQGRDLGHPTCRLRIRRLGVRIPSARTTIKAVTSRNTGHGLDPFPYCTVIFHMVGP
jgi:hypothetical protein